MVIARAASAPKYSLATLDHFGQFRASPDGLPISGATALKIIRDEAVNYAHQGLTQVEEQLPTLDIVRNRMDGKTKADERLSDRIASEASAALQRMSELNRQLKEIEAAPRSNDLATEQRRIESIGKIVDELKTLQANTKDRMEECERAAAAAKHDADKLAAAEQALTAVHVDLDRVKRDIPIEYVAALITGGALFIFGVGLELAAAYWTALRIEPYLGTRVSLEYAVLIIFLIGFAIVTPLIDRLVDQFYWLIYRTRLEKLKTMVDKSQAVLHRFRITCAELERL